MVEVLANLKEQHQQKARRSLGQVEVRPSTVEEGRGQDKMKVGIEDFFLQC